MADLSHLNPQQRAAAMHLGTPLLVLAGAGSGKTRVITHKIAYLIEECDYQPRHIAAITFTNKAAREMQERVGKLLSGQSAKGLTVTTFHSLGLHILREEADKIGYKARFSILDSADQYGIAAEILKTTDKKLVRQLQSIISNWKNALLTPQQAIDQAGNELEAQAAKLYRAYQDTLRAYQAVDFDDLIKLPVELFQQDNETLAKWQNKLRYLLVDEYQDTNACQYQLLKLLTGMRGAFTAVGDDDQSIYAWRGADQQNIERLGKDFPSLSVIKLEQNYRSTTRILNAANTLIANNPKLYQKNLWSELGHGEPIKISAASNEDDEAERVVLKIQAHQFQNRTRYGDYAILYRSNHQSRPFEQQLRNARIPYILSGGTSFFERSEIKDLISYLRLIANSDDDPAFIRAVTTPKRGVGAGTLEKLGLYAGRRHVSLFAAVFEPGFALEIQERLLEPLTEFCNFINRLQYRAEREPAGELLQELLRAIEYENWLYDNEEARAAESKWQNVQDFVAWMTKKGEEDGKNLLALTQTIALMSLLENRDEENPDAVRMSTLHASKGLEYPHVFLVGVEEEILPHRESLDGEKLAEERRLMYVGVTRAQKTLNISYCHKRKRGGEWASIEPSRFLEELGPDIDKPGKVQPEAEKKAQGKAALAGIMAMLGEKTGG